MSNLKSYIKNERFNKTYKDGKGKTSTKRNGDQTLVRFSYRYTNYYYDTDTESFSPIEFGYYISYSSLLAGCET